MKINEKIKNVTFVLVICLVTGLLIHKLQENYFDYLKKNGKYTIAIGKDTETWRRVGTRIFTYEFNIDSKVYEGKTSLTGHANEMTVGGIYFVLFDPKKPKENFLIKYPPVTAEINLDSIPAEGWSELPVSVPKDSIRNFLD